MQEFFYNGIKRLDWGFGNPNITAGLIATLLMAVWGLAFIHRLGFWPALVGFTALGVCLIQTASRGGLVAAILGGVVLVACLRRPWSRGRWIPIVVSLVLLGSYAIWHGVATRYGKGIVEEDASVSNRWLIYRMAPAMMVDAPGGWGHKRAAEAYHHFYQPVGRLERYGSLVSSHLTWMVEWSWWGRMAYVAGWFGVLVLCLPSSRRRWYAVVLAVWVAFGAAAMFTNMANRWVLWVVPGMLFLGAVGMKGVLRDWPSRRRCAGAGVGVLAVLGALVFWGAVLVPSRPSIALRSGWVCVGEEKEHGGAEAIWIVAPDPAVLGRAYGQGVRSLLQEGAAAGALLVEWNLGELVPVPSDTVVFSGRGVAGFEGDRLAAAVRAGRWILLNPDMPPRALMEALDSSPPTQIVWGEFHAGNARYVWEGIAGKDDHIRFERAIAAGQYLPNWTKSTSDDSPASAES